MEMKTKPEEMAVEWRFPTTALRRICNSDDGEDDERLRRRRLERNDRSKNTQLSPEPPSPFTTDRSETTKTKGRRWPI
ncbi:hypothetical protein ACS0TY_001023 [Phlomoides rotata]